MGKFQHIAKESTDTISDVEWDADDTHRDSQGNPAYLSRSATLIVAASDATDKEKGGADYVCDGTADEVEIQAALAALPLDDQPEHGGGKIMLSTGHFYLDAAFTQFTTESNITIEGQGQDATYLMHDFNGNVFSWLTLKDTYGLNWDFKNFGIKNVGGKTGCAFVFDAEDEGATDYGYQGLIKFENIRFGYFQQGAIDAQILHVATFINCYFIANGDATHNGVNLDYKTNQGCHDISFIRCLWEQGEGNDVYIAAGVYAVSFFEPYFDGTSGAASLHAHRNALNVRVYGGEIAKSTDTGVSIYPCEGMELHGVRCIGKLHNVDGPVDNVHIFGGSYENTIYIHGDEWHIIGAKIHSIQSPVTGSDYGQIIGNIIEGDAEDTIFLRYCTYMRFADNIIGNTNSGNWLRHRDTAANNSFKNNTIKSGSLVTETNPVEFEGNTGYVHTSEQKMYSGSLASGNADAFAFAWQNPEAQKLLIEKVVVETTTAGGSANSVLDVGVVGTATTHGDDVIDGVDLNATAVYDSRNATDAGTNGVQKPVLCDENGGTNDYVTGQILVANAASLVGKYYIYAVGR